MVYMGGTLASLHKRQKLGTSHLDLNLVGNGDSEVRPFRRMTGNARLPQAVVAARYLASPYACFSDSRTL